MDQPLASIPNALAVLLAIAEKVPPKHVEFLAHFDADYDSLKHDGEAAAHLTVYRFLKDRYQARTTTIQQLYDALVQCGIDDAAEHLLSVAPKGSITDAPNPTVGGTLQRLKPTNFIVLTTSTGTPNQCICSFTSTGSSSAAFFRSRMDQPLASIPNTLVVLMGIAEKVPPKHVEFLAHFNAEYYHLKHDGEAAAHLTVYRFLKDRCQSQTTTIQQLYDVLVQCGIDDAAKHLRSVAPKGSITTSSLTSSASINYDLDQIDSIVEQVGGLHRSIIITITTETVV
jgi:hypothetical protein